LIKSDYFNTFRCKFLIVIYYIELKGICKGEKTKGGKKEERKKEKRKEKEERPHHPVLMYKCICLKVGACKMKHTFNIKRNIFI